MQNPHLGKTGEGTAPYSWIQWRRNGSPHVSRGPLAQHSAICDYNTLDVCPTAEYILQLVAVEKILVDFSVGETTDGACGELPPCAVLRAVLVLLFRAKDVAVSCIERPVRPRPPRRTLYRLVDVSLFPSNWAADFLESSVIVNFSGIYAVLIFSRFDHDLNRSDAISGVQQPQRLVQSIQPWQIKNFVETFKCIGIVIRSPFYVEAELMAILSLAISRWYTMHIKTSKNILPSMILHKALRMMSTTRSSTIRLNGHLLRFRLWLQRNIIF